jgi:hypothetical protein
VICSVKKVLEWSNGAIVPVIVGTFYNADATVLEPAPVSMTSDAETASGGGLVTVPTSTVVTASQPPSVSAATVTGPFPVPKKRRILWPILIGVGILWYLVVLLTRLL